MLGDSLCNEQHTHTPPKKNLSLIKTKPCWEWKEAVNKSII